MPTRAHTPNGLPNAPRMPAATKEAPHHQLHECAHTIPCTFTQQNNVAPAPPSMWPTAAGSAAKEGCAAPRAGISLAGPYLSAACQRLRMKASC